MYLFKSKDLAKKYNKNIMASEIGLHPDTIRKTLNQGKSCSKVIAYCITKFIDKDAEISDYFFTNNEREEN